VGGGVGVELVIVGVLTGDTTLSPDDLLLIVIGSCGLVEMRVDIMDVKKPSPAHPSLLLLFKAGVIRGRRSSERWC